MPQSAPPTDPLKIQTLSLYAIAVCLVNCEAGFLCKTTVAAREAKERNRWCPEGADER